MVAGEQVTTTVAAAAVERRGRGGDTRGGRRVWEGGAEGGSGEVR